MGQDEGRGLPPGLLALAADAEAVCATIHRSGASMVEPPGELSARFTMVTAAGSPLDAIDPAWQSLAISLFEAACEHGEAAGEVRTAIDAETVYGLHIFDLAPHHDCLATVLRPTRVVASDGAQQALQAREELLVRLTDALPTGILQVDPGGETVFSNARWFEITELHRRASFADFVRLCENNDRARISAGMERTRTSGVDSELEVNIHTTADNRRVCRLRLCGLGEAGGDSSVLACLDDVTESHQLQHRLREQARRDALTGLLNRAAIMSRLDDCITTARERHRSAAVLFVDLDDFKEVNDRFGHAAGDDLLRRVGDTIKECVRSEDLVGRLGGDEFVVVIPDLIVPAAAIAMARRLEIEISTLIVAPGERLLSGSVGLAILDSSVASADELLASADRAMYVAKRSRAQGRGPQVTEPG